MNIQTRNLLKLHVAVLLFGFSSLFGKFISLAPVVIVCGRTFFASIFLFIIIRLVKNPFIIRSKSSALKIFLTGVLFAIHWFTFFKSVQVSTVAIAVLTFSTYPVFVTFLEPIFYREKVRIFDIVIAFITLVGVIFIIPNFEMKNNFTQGALWGIASGISGALLSLLCKKCLEKEAGIIIAFYQYVFCTLVLLPFVIFYKPEITLNEWALLLILGTLFTAVSGTLFISSLETIKVQFASIVTCLEPVYAIILAGLLLNEIPTLKTLLGGLIILFAVIYATLYKQQKTSAVLP